MKLNLILSLIAMSLLVSCGKKEILAGPEVSSSTSSKSTSASETQTPINGKKPIVDPRKQPQVSDNICIEEAMKKDLEDKEKVSKITADSDITYCNGLRVRLKIFRFSTGDHRAYGYAISSSGRQSCIKQGRDFSKNLLMGYKGSLLGSGIKISLGGHSYDGDNKLISSKKFSAKHVNFDFSTFSGEMGFFENDELVCWSIQ